MNEERTQIIVLSDGDPTLAHFSDLLREKGYVVQDTATSHEAALRCARHPGSILVARSPLLPTPATQFLGPLRSYDPEVFVILTGPPSTPRIEGVDLLLCEPYRFSSLLDAVTYSTTRRQEPVTDPSVWKPAAASSLSMSAPRLLACARRLSELERDPEQLLTTAMEMFVEIGQSERGVICLRSDDGAHLDVTRRSGFRNGGGPHAQLRMGATLVGEVAQSGVPVLGTSKADDDPLELGVPFFLLPIRDRRTVMGVVGLGGRRGAVSVGQEDLDTVLFLAHQFAVNLANSRALEELSNLTVVDPLTGLFNRRYFDRQITLELERARRYDRQVTLALLDIDNFKTVNDSEGYAVGDSVIRSVGRLVRGNVREVDIVTRWGGDEFAILLPETGKPRFGAELEVSSVKSVERIRRAVETEDLSRHIAGFSARVTLSAGVSTFPADARDRESLFRLANEALRRAKRAGTNRVCLASETAAELGRREDA